MTDSQHLAWIVGRLINVHGENPSVDYMIRLQEIVKRLNLPPKAEPESKEFPQVGDKCLYAGEVFTFLCKSPFDGDAVLARNSKIDWDVISVGFNDLLKPKTEAEILRDDLESYLSGIVWVDTKAMAVDLLKHYNITKKV